MLICASTNIQIYQRVTMNIMAQFLYIHVLGYMQVHIKILTYAIATLRCPKYITQINDKNLTASETNVN